MRLVILESPYAGDVERNVLYARRCMHDCFARGEAPFASHLLYTQAGVLDDADSEQRKLGIAAGLEWGKHAHATVVYCDYGVTEGMQLGIDRADREYRSVERRWIMKNDAVAKEYAGDHWDGSGAKFSVFRVDADWFWMYPVVNLPVGPYPNAKSAYEGALGR